MRWSRGGGGGLGKGGGWILGVGVDVGALDAFGSLVMCQVMWLCGCVRLLLGRHDDTPGLLMALRV